MSAFDRAPTIELDDDRLVVTLAPSIEHAGERDRRSRSRSVIVVAEPAVQLVMARAAVRGQWDVAARIEPATDGTIADHPALRHLHVDELIVQVDLLAEVRRAAPALLEQADSLRLVHRDIPDGGSADGDPPFANPLPAMGRAVKRTIDIVAALLLLLMLLPVLLLTALAVRLESPGSAMFRQMRVGAGGKVFRIYKFRTMHAHSSEVAHQQYLASLINGDGNTASGGVFKLVNDPRITRVGAVLRRFSLDELPQFWNVLRGDMSLIGPRPDVMAAAELYDAYAWRRFEVKPGVTGAWQVSGRASLDYATMVKLDVEYAATWSLGKDLAILARTPAAVLSGHGAV